MRITSESLWVMKMTLCPSERSRSTSPNICSTSSGVRTAVGSSRTSSFTPRVRHRTISRRCRCDITSESIRALKSTSSGIVSVVAAIADRAPSGVPSPRPPR
jgi:hypothetical protein